MCQWESITLISRRHCILFFPINPFSCPHASCILMNADLPSLVRGFGPQGCNHHLDTPEYNTSCQKHAAVYGHSSFSCSHWWLIRWPPSSACPSYVHSRFYLPHSSFNPSTFSNFHILFLIFDTSNLFIQSTLSTALETARLLFIISFWTSEKIFQS